MEDGILKGLRVIEWGDLVSGPWARPPDGGHGRGRGQG